MAQTRCTRKRHKASDDEVEQLRRALDVERAAGKVRQARIDELEREMSTHSWAIARLLAD
ncbi:MAG: hypothetical protein ACREKH_21300 [Candidatus Rokuibacteriota bacterium]